MEFTVSLDDVLMFILSALGVALLIYLIITIKNLNSVIKKARDVLDSNKREIDDTLTSLPKIAKNVENITDDVRTGVLKVTDTAKTIEKHFTGADNFSEKTEITVDLVQTVAELVRMVIGLFSKNKR